MVNLGFKELFNFYVYLPICLPVYLLPFGVDYGLFYIFLFFCENVQVVGDFAW